MIRIFSVASVLLLTSGSYVSELRDAAFQLSSGSISIGGAAKVRNQRHVGRNPPGFSDGYDFTPQGGAPLPPPPAPLARNPAYQNQNYDGVSPSPPPPNPRPRPPARGGAVGRNNANHNAQNPNAPAANRNIPSPVTGEATRYYYPPRMPLPLATCFHNPTGYVCCNKHLNDLIVDTYTELESRPKFHTCNINAIARELQLKAETRFNTTFETVASYEDFAQKIHFNGDLACKVEIGGKYMLAYGTVKDADIHLTGEDQFVGPKPARALHHISKRHSAFF
uniref:Ground-like domain-containing protein n=1 Tax=Panagrellus redivivus TaxID=6233 RepID=A0A7E4VNL0_PANRE